MAIVPARLIAACRIASRSARRVARRRPRGRIASASRRARGLAAGLIAAALVALPPVIAPARADDAPPAPAPAAPDGAVLRAELVYRTSGTFMLGGLPMTLHARTTTSWHVADGHYETHLHMDTVDFDELSNGRVGPDGELAPDRFTEKRPFHAAEAVIIDWPKATIQFGPAAPVPAPAAGAQDRLSLQFELARLRARHPESYGTGTTHAVTMIGTRSLDPWTFTVGPEETIETGMGSTRAVRIWARRPVRDVEETIEVWLGVDLRWMPVRIRMVDRNRSVIDSVLQSAQFP